MNSGDRSKTVPPETSGDEERNTTSSPSGNDIPSNNPDDRHRYDERRALREVRGHVDRLQQEFRQQDERSDHIFRMIVLVFVGLIVVLGVSLLIW